MNSNYYHLFLSARKQLCGWAISDEEMCQQSCAQS